MFANSHKSPGCLTIPGRTTLRSALNRQSQKMKKTSYLLGLILTWVYWRGSHSVNWNDRLGKRAFSFASFGNVLWTPRGFLSSYELRSSRVVFVEQPILELPSPLAIFVREVVDLLCDVACWAPLAHSIRYCCRRMLYFVDDRRQQLGVSSPWQVRNGIACCCGTFVGFFLPPNWNVRCFCSPPGQCVCVLHVVRQILLFFQEGGCMRNASR